MKQKKKWLAPASLGVLVLLGAGAWLIAQQSSSVSAEDLAATVASLETPQPAVPGDAVVQSQKVVREVQLTGSKLVDTTYSQMEEFGSAAEYAILVSSGEYVEPIQMTADECFKAWALEQLPGMDGKSFIGVHQVCDREAVVLAGGYGMTGRDLLAYAIFEDDGKEVSDLILDGQKLSYASVAAEDNRAILVVVAPST